MKKYVLPALSLFVGISSISYASERPKQPNIVLILTDDLGWQDVKCYDIDEPTPMETPNIDAFAKKGVMFWNGYSPAPTCAPSRCAIMSGVHPARAQKTHVVGGAPPRPIRKKTSVMMDPWYSGRMPTSSITIAEALKSAGYTTGHTGKWHMAIDHHAFPQPEDQGFDITTSVRGTRQSMPNRLTGFATTNPEDPYKLDENGFPYHQNNVNALQFLEEQKDKPFFLYYATWLVHTPIHIRSEALLDKYCKKLGVENREAPLTWGDKGQTNPFYCAMVESLDYYVGQVFNYLETTEDPRWPGHKLSENTYVIFTSDNGGMEGGKGGKSETYTDNYPLDRGKISAMEGGVRVPLIIAGPSIPKAVESNVVVNGLDFYPTILQWAGVEKAAETQLDGSDLSELLSKDPTNATLVKSAEGQIRDTMIWHFPHGHALESTIVRDGFKLIKNYNHKYDPNTEEFELYQLYQREGGEATRVDIEEKINLASKMPEKLIELSNLLSENLNEMEASLPYYNPLNTKQIEHKEKVPTIVKVDQAINKVICEYQTNGATLVRADLIYTFNGNQKYEEWHRLQATISGNNTVTVELPEGTTHFFINLIDENNFLVNYPELPDEIAKKQGQAQYAIARKP